MDHLVAGAGEEREKEGQEESYEHVEKQEQEEKQEHEEL